jgi:AcrR family transcriptional regulator
MTPTPTPTPERTDTYRRYLDAAEQAFIRFGYEGASIRRISSDAQAPLGTLHHYWGNKEALFRDVCERRFAPIQAEQLQRLRAAGSLEAVVRGLISPPILADASSPAQQQTIRLLYGRVLTEPSEVVMRLVKQMFLEATQLCLALLRQYCPQLSEERFYWRFTCALGAFIFSQSFGDRVAYASGRSLEGTDWRFVVEEITAFIVQGMQGDPQAGRGL